MTPPSLLPCPKTESELLWMEHLELHLTEHDLRHAGLALRAAYPTVLKYIARLERLAMRPLEPVPQWVSVEERLPENGIPVALLFSGNDTRAGAMFGHKFKMWHFYTTPITDGREPTHWMPLPAAPVRAGEEEGK